MDQTASLTAWEWRGLHQRFNLADGHAHQSLSRSQCTVVDDLPRLFYDAEVEPQADLEGRFTRRFFELAGQTAALTTGTPILHYSASVATDVVAKALTTLGLGPVGVIAPTFDNIPQLLRRNNVEIKPLTEKFFAGPLPVEAFTGLAAVFLVLPNNPTGMELSRDGFAKLARAAAAANVVLICDCSFRFFSDLHTWDQYEVLSTTADLDYIMIEDTGKTWPTRDVKIGMLCSSSQLRRVIADISNEVLLNVSPVTVMLLERFLAAEEVRSDAAPFLCADVANVNRECLRQALSVTAVAPAIPTSKISVEWMYTPGDWHAPDLAAWLSERGIGILPGGPFHWDAPEQGDHSIRIALMRDVEYFAEAVGALARHLSQYRP
ncbi:MAG TPA: aminotransferase class I/II-fold pyridoxal phosphate-dependent enzyme [Solirubrobacteraceae bacterium]|nr:aminotransferase class I/II-fold pyridoxal phosphate-dependent enzyme [Solirubrobacteraceae bacterium]